jgi:hypothetical protein
MLNVFAGGKAAKRNIIGGIGVPVNYRVATVDICTISFR